jgi:hypothetical protein
VCCPIGQFCSGGTCRCFQGTPCGRLCCEAGRVCGEQGDCVCAPGTECGDTCCLPGTACAADGQTCCRTSCVGAQCGVYHDTCDGEPLDCGTTCRVGGAFCSDPDNGGVCVCSLRAGEVSAEILVCS